MPYSGVELTQSTQSTTGGGGCASGGGYIVQIGGSGNFAVMDTTSNTSLIYSGLRHNGNANIIYDGQFFYTHASYTYSSWGDYETIDIIDKIDPNSWVTTPVIASTYVSRWGRRFSIGLSSTAMWIVLPGEVRKLNRPLPSNPAGVSWSSIGTSVATISGALSVTVYNDRVFVTGGNGITEIDNATGSIISNTPLSPTLNGWEGRYYNNKLYFSTSNTSVPFWAFDLSSNTVSSVTATPPGLPTPTWQFEILGGIAYYMSSAANLTAVELSTGRWFNDYPVSNKSTRYGIGIANNKLWIPVNTV